jgi:hypothetical protein
MEQLLGLIMSLLVIFIISRVFNYFKLLKDEFDDINKKLDDIKEILSKQ